jgi:hypothetical protein
MSDPAKEVEWQGRSWAVGSAVVFTVAVLIPGVGVGFGVCGVCAAIYVLIARRYSRRQKSIAATCVGVSVLLTAFWLFVLSGSFI